MKSKLHKKYYVPGLVSAIFIPLVFWYFVEKRLDNTIYTVNDFGIPAKLSPENYGATFEP